MIVLATYRVVDGKQIRIKKGEEFGGYVQFDFKDRKKYWVTNKEIKQGLLK